MGRPFLPLANAAWLFKIVAEKKELCCKTKGAEGIPFSAFAALFGILYLMGIFVNGFLEGWRAFSRVNERVSGWDGFFYGKNPEWAKSPYSVCLFPGGKTVDNCPPAYYNFENRQRRLGFPLGKTQRLFSFILEGLSAASPMEGKILPQGGRGL